MKLSRIFLFLFCMMFSLTAQAEQIQPIEQVQFYQNGNDKFEALIADMQQARHHIHVEYFIFANDDIADRLLQVMRRKVRQGVKVRLIIDGYYDVKRDYNYRYHLGMLQADGIDVHLYNPYVAPYINHNLRDHRKIVVIDGRVGYTGGFNVADYNIQGKPGVYGSYVDTHVRMEGAAVEQLQSAFADHFVHVGGDPFEGEAYYPFTMGEERAGGDIRASVVERSRHNGNRRTLRKSVVSMIDEAHHNLYIQSPYLLPTPGIRRALRRALRRGVDVNIMFSERGDTRMFDFANATYARKLQRRGAHVWLYEEGFLHSKVLTADGYSGMVGSMNLDYRAMRWNEEIAVRIFDTRFVRDLNVSFEKQKEHSKVFDEQYYKNLPIEYRISGHFIDYFLGWCL